MFPGKSAHPNYVRHSNWASFPSLLRVNATTYTTIASSSFPVNYLALNLCLRHQISNSSVSPQAPVVSENVLTNAVPFSELAITGRGHVVLAYNYSPAAVKKQDEGNSQP